MKTIIAAMMLSLVSANVFGQRFEMPERIFIDQRIYVAEPAARLARCGRMDLAEHLIDTYVNLYALSLASPPAFLREQLFKMSYEQYDLLERDNWPDPQATRLECAAQARRSLELIAWWNFQ